MIRRGFSDWDTLSKNEQAVAHSYWGDPVNHALMALTLHEEGVLSLRDYVGWEDNALSAIATDGVAKWWTDQCEAYRTSIATSDISRAIFVLADDEPSSRA